MPELEHLWVGRKTAAPNIAIPDHGDEWRGRKQAPALSLLALLAFLLPAPPLAAAGAAPEATACDAATAPAGPRIEVVVSGARTDTGNMTITLYGSDPRRFLASGGRIARQRVPVRGGLAAACFAVPTPGEYAVAVYHDEDNDHDFKRNMIGLPAEGYGFSNDAPARLGLPSFDSARFHASAQGARMPVKLRY
ncbi:MAG: hypothetical protein JWP20_914 [Roseomonas sp.]|nr:hypothetical protein [Roseomonas sp.]